MSKRSAEAVHERMQQVGLRALSDAELLAILLGPTAGMNSLRDAAQRLLDALPLSQIAWAPPEELQQQPGITAPCRRGRRLPCRRRALSWLR